MQSYALAVALALVAAPVVAQDTVALPSLGTQLAVDLAEETVAACAADGYNVAAAVTDRSGILLALVRAEGAGAHTANAAMAKAYTSASSRNPTSGMAKTVQENPGAAGLVDIPGFLVLAGGVPVKAGDATVGAIGVGGAPGGNLDETCALRALEKLADRLK
ncbi:MULTISPECIES: heme-binding protein [Paracoccus]|uniref:Heme-binding protein n=1 Tax=Paracoccus litorisediminis TaxID=2006130 RepID=A0A844HVI2_9RHOB|nr:MULTISPECIES: heme-binding protein [Paracoccus]MBD9529524.1 heme-binding protein [Paracoccus sp. PAR01]MTH62325.1 heme-binding protein [Paracoccus litorisediminis]